MPGAELVARGAQTMAVCNACRYCEGYCPTFPAMERRSAFEAADLEFLAHVCHNCGECLYACQYAPPHAFGIDVPRLFAEIRLASYEAHAWPAGMARAFARQGPATALGLVALFVALLLAGWRVAGRPVGEAGAADFYAVVPHALLVALFGGVGLFVAGALAVSASRYWRTIAPNGRRPALSSALAALRDGVTLRHLHASGADCVTGHEQRTPWRRWWHHATLGGFALSFASTSVAAVYHVLLGWEAPYPVTSLPVVLGALGGLGLVVGPVGQWMLRERRDPRLIDPRQRGMDGALLLLLWLTSATGLALLALRATAAMPALLLVHLGAVLALFVALPYGKFVHAAFRLAALSLDAAERSAVRSAARSGPSA